MRLWTLLIGWLGNCKVIFLLLHVRCNRRLWHVCEVSFLIRSPASPEEAPRSLLRGGSPYDCRPSNESLGSYQADLVSFPNDVSGCPLLTEVLPSDDCRYLEEQSELMLAECINADTSVEPFWDPKLRYKKNAITIWCVVYLGLRTLLSRAVAQEFLPRQFED